MHLLDEYVSRRVTPAQVYRSDLLQILELHKKLRSVDNALQVHANVDVEHESATETDGLTIACPVPVGLSPDPVWSHVRNGSDGAPPTHLETIRSVIENLDADSTDALDYIMLNGDWTWDLDNLWGFL